MSRRGLLRLAGMGEGAASLVMMTGCDRLGSDGPMSTVDQVDFGPPLHIPPLAESAVEHGSRVFGLAVQSGRTAIVLQGESDTWGVNGSFLVPTLRAVRGETVQMHVSNGLAEPATLHWHGMRLRRRIWPDGGIRSTLRRGCASA